MDGNGNKSGNLVIGADLGKRWVVFGLDERTGWA